MSVAVYHPGPAVARQTRLPLTVDVKIPVMTVSAARGALNETAAGVLDMIEEGRIEWAWDIASRSSARREIRILAVCIADVQGDRPATVDGERTAADVMRILFGDERPVIFGAQLYRKMLCKHDHLTTLIREGSLRVVGEPARKGRGGSPALDWGSVKRFIEERRVL